MNDSKCDSKDLFDDEIDCSTCAMFKDFYNKKMAPIVIFIWVYALIMIALTVFCGNRFFDATNDTQAQIMYAVGFTCGLSQICLIKIFAWQMIHRNNLKRDIKQLRREISQLAAKIKA